MATPLIGTPSPSAISLSNGTGAQFNVSEAFTITDIELLLWNPQNRYWLDAQIYTDGGDAPSVPISGLYKRTPILNDPNLLIEWEYISGI